ncbi:phage portal protein [Urbifossiella limnaea]|uniref:Phage portal protein n=1 Tax=Urbifossiella limnaea TaxID=2528023 RepID=A0A517Y2L2_9BACT|nr:phage portal protein [Urbifossiella limnaea]QDU24033.1 Phage portal protein [Urbifossiella limnaea]
MLDWLTRLWRGTPGAADPAGGLVPKAPRSATLTTYMGTGGFGMSPTWNDVDTARFNTGWVFACVRAIADRIAGQPIRVGRVTSTPRRGSGRRGGPGTVKAASAAPPWMRAGSVEELDAHPLLDALHDPNPYLVPYSLIGLTIASLRLAGVGFWWIDRERDGTTRIWYLPAGWVTEDPDATVPLSKFIVRPAHSADEFHLDATELIRFSTPDPANPFDNLSPLKAGLAAVQTDREIQTAQLLAFRNGVLGGTLVTVGQLPEAGGAGAVGDPDGRPLLTRHQRNTLAQRIQEAYAGSANTGQPIILDALIRDVRKLSDSPAEMDFGGSSGITKERVTQLFGVNPIILGQVEGANRASATVADEHFCFTTLAPLCVLIGQTLTKWFRVHHDDPGLVVWVEPPRPRDPDGKRADLEQLARYGAIRVNELRQEHGLPADPDGEGWVKGTAAVAAGASADGERRAGVARADSE